MIPGIWNAHAPGRIGSINPSVQRPKRPSRYYPQVLGDEAIPVKVTTAERTFWEKVTIAHQIAFANKKIPQVALSATTSPYVERSGFYLVKSNMITMFYGTSPNWPVLVEELRRLEQSINTTESAL